MGLLAFLLPALVAFAFFGPSDSDDERTEDKDNPDNGPDNPPEQPRTTGTSLADFLEGTGGEDNIFGAGGNDEILGRAASDTIDGGSGDDTLRGGGGGDLIDDDQGSDLLRGWNGNDTLSAIDRVNGAPDILSGGEGDDLLYGNDGDTLTGDGGSNSFNVVLGDAGAAPVVITDLDFDPDDPDAAPDRVNFLTPEGELIPRSAFFDGTYSIGIGNTPDNTGSQVYFGSQIVAEIEGYKAFELFYSTAWIGNFQPGNSGLFDGDDAVTGTDGADDLFGGPGDDTIDGVGGSDYLSGDAGNDLIIGVDDPSEEPSPDRLVGGAGWDTLRADDGDFVGGGTGRDTYEIVVPFSEDSEPVRIDGYEFVSETGLPEPITLVDKDGNPLSRAAVVNNLVIAEEEGGENAALVYNGKIIAVMNQIDPDILQDQAAFIGNLRDDDLTPPENPGTPLLPPQQQSDVQPDLQMEFQSATPTGSNVTDEMFGGNVIFSINTEDGLPTESFTAAIDALDIGYIRFPAGQGDYLYRSPDGEGALNVVTMEPNEDGEMDLRQEVRSALDWARDPNGDGSGEDAVKLTFVLPTINYTIEEYEEFAAEIEAFAERAMRDYSDVIQAFEIGNEYWSTMGEAEYAEKVNIATQALENGMQAAGFGGSSQADIIIQMASPFSGSDFHSSVDNRPFGERVELANQAIIGGLTSETQASIDGVVEHYFYPQGGVVFDNSTLETDFIDIDYAIWNENFSKELDFYVTAWNSSYVNDSEFGMRSASVISEQLENMLEMGVDAAHVWPVQHNTANDLAGGPDAEPKLDAAGWVTNSINGAMFDLLSSNLVGTELIETEFSNHDGSVEINTYQSDDKTVFYVASRSLEELDMELDFSALVSEFKAASGVLLGIDQSTSDGVRFVHDQGYVEADFTFVDGERYYYDEHDVRAELTDFTFDSNVVSLSLKPFEVMQITFAN